MPMFFCRWRAMLVAGSFLVVVFFNAYAAERGVGAADFPILQMSPGMHSVRHLAEYLGRQTSASSRMTVPEKALFDELWKLVNLGVINVRAPHTSRYLFTLAARHQLSADQALAFFYRAVMGTFEPQQGLNLTQSRYVSPLKLMDNAFAAELESEGVLLKRSVEASSAAISTTLFIVRKGHGEALRQHIASSLKRLNDPILLADTLELFVIEDRDRDFVQWTYKD